MRNWETDFLTDFIFSVEQSRFPKKNNILWLENLVRGHFKDEEVTILSHNDAHSSNVMMDKDDTTGETLILIDFDLAAYGYRYIPASISPHTPFCAC